MEKIYIDTAKILKAISDPKRLKIVDMLSCSEQCAGKLQQAFCVTQPTLSHDMKVLVESGLILDRRNGKNIYYSLNPEALQQLYAIMGEIFRNKPHCVCEDTPVPVKEEMREAESSL
ncbi:ArsR/SmtB family transcription factor [Dialister sp.]|uniref:ArsR/SmtB family transcription factor n=1 Tax=Dialister sp. TaxID=1955814 RepID=UPI002E814493|nr:metalloregulator ArsR/SmtB family transcription factor [Dialister sp.]MEE3453547.1 metalloregulator ArsR/SmtB family transcription factor [Dialister sp.]